MKWLPGRMKVEHPMGKPTRTHERSTMNIVQKLVIPAIAVGAVLAGAPAALAATSSAAAPASGVAGRAYHGAEQPKFRPALGILEYLRHTCGLQVRWLHNRPGEWLEI
jgi:hypothetical protein